MSEAKICPQCGLPQQWEMWRKCHCGYDFGPPSQAPKRDPVVAKPWRRYHTFWLRFWAGVVDGLVFLPIDFADNYLSAPERGPFILIVWSVITYSAYWLYSVLLHARYGQTIGKMATGVKVLDVSEERIPTLRQAFIRDLGYIVLNTASLVYLIYLLILGPARIERVVATLPVRGKNKVERRQRPAAVSQLVNGW